MYVCMYVYIHIYICYEGVGGGDGDDGEGSTAKLYLAYCRYINDYQRLCP